MVDVIGGGGGLGDGGSGPGWELATPGGAVAAASGNARQPPLSSAPRAPEQTNHPSNEIKSQIADEWIAALKEYASDPARGLAPVDVGAVEAKIAAMADTRPAIGVCHMWCVCACASACVCVCVCVCWRCLVQLLTDSELARLRTFALCLARLQRRLRIPLPGPLAGKLMALFGAA